MSSEIIQNVAFDNHDDFEHVNFIFSQIFISLFWGLFNDETDLRVRYSILWDTWAGDHPQEDLTKFGYRSDM
jgi:hypothetical protein